jgi:hypothetical protein
MSSGATLDARSALSVLVEHLDSRGRVTMRERLTLDSSQPELTIGRSVGADVTIDDEHAAALHAMVQVTADGRLLVTDLGSINGVVVGGKRYERAAAVPLADGILQIGRTRLRVRTAHESLPPEKPDHHVQAVSLLARPGVIAAAGALLMVVQTVYSSWLTAPRDLAASAVWMLGVGFAIVAVWVSFWALLSRVMQGEWRWLTHAAVMLGISGVYFMLDDVLDLAWFALSLPRWSDRGKWMAVMAFGSALYLHMTAASTMSRRRVALLACVAPALLALASQWLWSRSLRQDVNHIDSSLRIYPPGARLRSAGSVEDYFRRAAALREAADRRRGQVDRDEDREE